MLTPFTGQYMLFLGVSLQFKVSSVELHGVKEHLHQYSSGMLLE